MYQVNGIFLNTFLIHFESYFPVYYVTRKHKTNDWLTTGIRTSCKRKQIFYIFSKLSNCPLIKSYYHYSCSILKRVGRNAKASYYNNIISSAKNKSKNSWNILRKEMGKLGSNKNISNLFEIDNIILNTHQVSNEFNNYFMNVVDSLTAGQKNIETASHFLHVSFQKGFPEMANIPIVDAAIVHTINSINNKNSAGCDEILNKIL
jgi:hypothetical protein